MIVSNTIFPKIIHIVDDDVDDQMLLQEALLEINAGISFYKSFDGRDGILKLQTDKIPRPDLIFADLNMPRMNGRQFLSQIMQDPKLNTIPVIIYSTAYDNNEVDEILKLGAAAFLQKPNDFSKLVERLKKELISIMIHSHH